MHQLGVPPAPADRKPGPVAAQGRSPSPTLQPRRVPPLSERPVPPHRPLPWMYRADQIPGKITG